MDSGVEMSGIGPKSPTPLPAGESWVGGEAGNLIRFMGLHFKRWPVLLLAAVLSIAVGPAAPLLAGPRSLQAEAAPKGNPAPGSASASQTAPEGGQKPQSPPAPAAPPAPQQSTSKTRAEEEADA